MFCELWVGKSKGLVFRMSSKSWAKALISGWLEECEAEEAAAAAAAAEAERQRVRERTQGPADAPRFAESLPKFVFFCFLRFWQLQP